MATPSGLPPTDGKQQHQQQLKSSAEMAKAGVEPSSAQPPKTADRDARNSDSNSRSVPLRLRNLPASFWQEPNVPKYNHQVITRATCGLPCCNQCTFYGKELFDPLLRQNFAGHHHHNHVAQPPRPQTAPMEPIAAAGLQHQKLQLDQQTIPYGYLWNYANLLPLEHVKSFTGAVPRRGPSSQSLWELSSVNDRPNIWRPIPTKTFSSRYHPFADVR